MGEVRFMISEAAKQVQVEPHVLRYWEDELELKIGRTEMGHRYYTEDDIQLFRCIQKLKDEGMLLRDLKPLIPELTATRKRLSENKKPTDDKQDKPAAAAAKKTAEHPAKNIAAPAAPAAQLTVTPAEVVPVTQLEQVRGLIGDVLTEVVSSNNETLEKNISKKVTNDVMREMDFLFQAKERREEEHYRKLDTLIRQQQANRRESTKGTPLAKLRKMII